MPDYRIVVDFQNYPESNTRADVSKKPKTAPQTAQSGFRDGVLGGMAVKAAEWAINALKSNVGNGISLLSERTNNANWDAAIKTPMHVVSNVTSLISNPVGYALNYAVFREQLAKQQYETEYYSKTLFISQGKGGRSV